MSRPHPAQIRFLSFLALAPAGGFVDLARIDQARQMRPGDDLFVPLVVARDGPRWGHGTGRACTSPMRGGGVLFGSELDAHARHPNVGD